MVRVTDAIALSARLPTRTPPLVSPRPLFCAAIADAAKMEILMIASVIIDRFIISPISTSGHRFRRAARRIS